MKIEHRFKRWAVEAYTDWSTWLFGVNWYQTAYYLHIGPATVGLYKWRYEDQPLGLVDILTSTQIHTKEFPS